MRLLPRPLASRFFGGVAAAVVPDQLESVVTTACRYEPGVQRAYEELAQHYGTAILPARPGSQNPGHPGIDFEAANPTAHTLACLRFAGLVAETGEA